MPAIFAAFDFHCALQATFNILFTERGTFYFN